MMDETKPGRRWYRKRRWWAFLLFWLVLSGPIATGPVMYGLRCGWFPPQPVYEFVSRVNGCLGVVGLRPSAEAYQRWWGMQGIVAEFDRRAEVRRQRGPGRPLPPPVMQRLRQGGFVRVTLRDGTSAEGYAASDPQEPAFIRMDGSAVEIDGTLRRFALRLPPQEIEAVQPLDAAPPPQPVERATILMPSEF